MLSLPRSPAPRRVPPSGGEDRRPVLTPLPPGGGGAGGEGERSPHMVAAPVVQLDPIKYEVFVHRLWAIGEEGRIALQRVSASPIVVQGGECMSSFYAPDGTMMLACSGHLRFAAATSDAIKKLLEWFGAHPGFYEGDQIFFNDPYVAGSHTYDQMVIMPIFHQGELIAWTASSSHTADV